MAAKVLKLRAVERSPTTAQYYVPKYKSPHQRPNYVKRFFPNEEIQNTLSQPWLRATDPMMPPYPYGGNHHFTEANHGLYGGLTIRSGNKISKGRNKGKTLRKWYPNIRPEKHVSKALGVEMTLPVAARVSRTIKKCGGLDEYLLGPKPARMKELGLLGWKLRWLVLNSESMKSKYKEERTKLGLSETLAVDTTFAEAWKDVEVREKLLEKMSHTWEKLKGNVLHHPRKLGLPAQIVEDEPSRRAKMPRVKTGFGMLERQTQQGQWQGIGAPLASATGEKKAQTPAGFKSMEELEELERHNGEDLEKEKDFMQGHVPMAGEMGPEAVPDLPLSSSVSSPIDRPLRETQEEEEERR